MNRYLKTIAAVTLAFGLFFAVNKAQAAQNISLQKAQEIATAHAQVPLKEVTFTQSSLDQDFMHAEYEIEFFHNNTEYEYEIDAEKGKIKNYSQENHANKQLGVNSQKSHYISEEQAKQVALKHANVKSPSFIRVKFDLDDGIALYEVDFAAEASRFEYEVNAINSKIIKIEKK